MRQVFDLVAHRGFQRPLRGIQLTQLLPQRAARLAHCRDRRIQFALAGIVGFVAQPQAVRQQLAQRGIDRQLGVGFPGRGLVGAERHRGVRALQALTAFLQVVFDAVGFEIKRAQGALVPHLAQQQPNDDGAGNDRYQRGQEDGEQGGGRGRQARTLRYSIHGKGKHDTGQSAGVPGG